MAQEKNRLGSFIRGAGYRSKFIRDFYSCPELEQFLSKLTGVAVAGHSVPSIACGINYAPQDITKHVDTWHVDSITFDIVILLVDPKQLKGGEFQFFNGTKEEGQKLLGSIGEQGTQNDLPSDRVTTVDFPAAGYGFLQQGNMVFHRACRLKERGERITMIPSFVVLDPSKPEGTNVANLLNWSDPFMAGELARYQAWLSMNRLENYIETIDLGASPARLAAQLKDLTAEIDQFVARLDQQ